KTQLCQKDRMMGLVSSPAGPPSSNDTENFKVGPINRIARNPAHVISERRIRCRSVNPCLMEGEGALETGDVVAALTWILYRSVLLEMRIRVKSTFFINQPGSNRTHPSPNVQSRGGRRYQATDCQRNLRCCCGKCP